MARPATERMPSFSMMLRRCRNDGRKPDLQAVGDLFVHIAAGDQRQHFGFASRKGRCFGTHRAGNDVFGPVRAVVHAPGCRGPIASSLVQTSMQCMSA